MNYELLMKTFLVRQAIPEDVEAIHAAHRGSILEIAAKDYPPEVVAEWGTNHSAEAIEKHKQSIRLGEEIVWVAVIQGKIEGFSALVPSNNELRAVYVTGIAARTGVGSALLEVLESRAKELGLKKLVLHSSITARPFYEKKGYKNLGPSLHRMRSGREMACYSMEKDLLNFILT